MNRNICFYKKYFFRLSFVETTFYVHCSIIIWYCKFPL